MTDGARKTPQSTVQRLRLPDPERCRLCGKRGRVYRSDRCGGYRRRRRVCRACDHRWTSYESIISPHKIRLRPRNK